jgi:hypothetical protein
MRRAARKNTVNAILLKRLILLTALSVSALPACAEGAGTRTAVQEAGGATAQSDSRAAKSPEQIRLAWDRVGSPIRWV